MQINVLREEQHLTVERHGHRILIDSKAGGMNGLPPHSRIGGMRPVARILNDSSGYAMPSADAMTLFSLRYSARRTASVFVSLPC